MINSKIEGRCKKVEKKSSIILMVIALVTLLVSVIGATFAYFTTGKTVANLNLTANTQGAAAFTATPGAGIALSITADKMQQTNVSNTTPSATGNSTLTVKLTSPANGTNVSCTYDIKYVDTGDAYTKVSAMGYTHEFSLEGSGKTGATAEAKSMAVTDYNTLTGKTTTVVSGASISASTTTGTSTVWTFTAKFYNVNAAQATNKKYAGNFYVDNVRC